MVDGLLTRWMRWASGPPCFRVYGKGRAEADWHVIDVVATPIRNMDSPWPRPFFRGTCITWTSRVIAVGWDFAERALREQIAAPASREHPVEVAGGRLRDGHRRARAGAPSQPSASEVMAHEIGHTSQVRWMREGYWVIGLTTLFREGPHFWNWFENQASAQGLFGGIVPGSVCPLLMQRVVDHPREAPPESS